MTDRPTDSHAITPLGRNRLWKRMGIALLLIVVLLGGGRAVLPSMLQQYVNRTLDQMQDYDGRVGDIDVDLYRGAYAIEQVKVVQTTGDVPVPLFEAERVDLSVEWSALLRGKIVGQIVMHSPVLNFVDAGDDEASDQTGAGEPWLQIIQELFPFTINSAVIHDGSIHFRAFGDDHPVDVYLSQLEARVDNLTNVNDEVTPLITTVEARALVMDQADLELQMQLNPFSYRPTFDMALRVLDLDVTRLNDLTRAYGAFDFEHGWFDMVLEVEATEGRIEGYVKPLFRNLAILNLEQDLADGNPLELFWEALVGSAEFLLRNQPLSQFATLIPFTGDFTNPNVDFLSMIGNVLRNAFIRAYLPQPESQGQQPQADELQFSPPSVVEPAL